MIRITNVKLSLDDAIELDQEKSNLAQSISKQYGIKDHEIKEFIIYKKAIDARKKNNVHFVYTLDLILKQESMNRFAKYKNIRHEDKLEYQNVESGSRNLEHNPVIIGFGPSGIFAALLLARRGYKPIVFERGYEVDKRTKEWNEFIIKGEFKENRSALFGEGGAGTFSDGKLTTSLKNIRNRFVLQELIKAGADPKILYTNKPHIGTDVLKKVIANIRQEIISLGGQIHFESKVTDFIIKDNILQALIINDQEIKTQVCLLGIGHSARDTFHTLLDRGLQMEQKPFSVGLRIEHKQEMINKSQYGPFHDHPALGAAEYKLHFHSKSGRSAYTFCMCPGGYVINSMSQEGGLVTNGMSYSKRNGENANSALLVNVGPDDFIGDHPLAGIKFQEQFEKKAYQLVGQKISNPLQLVGDFLDHKISTKIGHVQPTIKPGYSFVDMHDIYPKYITDTLKEALQVFDKKLHGFASHDALLTGPETRSSSPVKIYRNHEHESSIKGIYPMGEGPGYAGGIMSAAIDGMKTAEEIIKIYKAKRT